MMMSFLFVALHLVAIGVLVFGLVFRFGPLEWFEAQKDSDAASETVYVLTALSIFGLCTSASYHWLDVPIIWAVMVGAGLAIWAYIGWYMFPSEWRGRMADATFPEPGVEKKRYLALWWLQLKNHLRNWF